MKRTRSANASLTWTTCSVLLLMAMTLSAPATAHAAGIEDLTTAQRTELAGLLKQARAAYSQGDFDAALEHYKRANELLDEPEIIYQIALCHDKAEHVEEAHTSYKTYLERAPETKRRGQVEARIASLDARLQANKTGSLELVTTPRDATIWLAGEPVRADDPRLRDIPAGQTLDLEIRASGHKTHTATVTIEPGKTHRLEVALQKHQEEPTRVIKTPPDPVDAPRDQPRARLWWSIAGASGAGALVTGMSSAMIQRGVARDRADCVDECDMSTSTGESARAALDARQQRANVLGITSWALLAIGSTSAIIAITRRTNEDTSVTTRAALSPRGVTLELTW